MATTSRTWFYTEPEHRPYFISQRVNQSLWAMRFVSVYMDCVRAEPPFRVEGTWNDNQLSMDWVPNQWLRLTASKEDLTLVRSFAQMLQFNPMFSYTDQAGQFVCEWWRADGTQRYQQVQGQPGITNIKTYKK